MIITRVYPTFKKHLLLKLWFSKVQTGQICDRFFWESKLISKYFIAFLLTYPIMKFLLLKNEAILSKRLLLERCLKG